MPAPYRVAVVGFGVGGATTAFLLARAGHRVDLFERAPVVGPVGAGILLQPSGQMVLRRLGLLDAVLPHGEPVHELHALQPDGRDLIRLPWADIGPGCCAYGLHRGDLFNVLHAAVAAQPVSVHLDHEVRSTRNTPDGDLLLDTCGRAHGPFDLVVAADGSRSTLRGACRLVKWVREYDFGALWVIGRSTAVRGKLHQVVRHTVNLLGLLPMGGGRCSLFWSQRNSQCQTLLRRGFRAWRAEVLRLCPLAEELLAPLDDLAQVPYTTYQHVWMPRWHTGRVVFLGDAAHAMSPHLGQGINLAMLDAWHLAEALARCPTPQDAFRAYTVARRAHLRFYSWVTFALTPFFQSNEPILGWGRDVALPLMTRWPWLRYQMALTMGGVKRGFLGGGWSL
jgi:2-polyprenyl-6-methoxyphenol hydroxylase-like FAD-dependent oxidoreductase